VQLNGHNCSRLGRLFVSLDTCARLSFVFAAEVPCYTEYSRKIYNIHSDLMRLHIPPTLLHGVAGSCHHPTLGRLRHISFLSAVGSKGEASNNCISITVFTSSPHLILCASGLQKWPLILLRLVRSRSTWICIGGFVEFAGRNCNILPTL
jgi:hypothetical protein